IGSAIPNATEHKRRLFKCCMSPLFDSELPFGSFQIPANTAVDPLGIERRRGRCAPADKARQCKSKNARSSVFHASTSELKGSPSHSRNLNNIPFRTCQQPHAHQPQHNTYQSLDFHTYVRRGKHWRPERWFDRSRTHVPSRIS